jgi:quercetin dioxygenase-like cupin family protein
MTFIENLIDKLVPKHYFSGTCDVLPNFMLFKAKSNNLTELRKLTPKLSEIPTLGPFVQEKTEDGVIYEKDKFWGIKICHIPNVLAAQKIYMKKGTFLDLHRHEELEIGIIKRGVIRFTIDNKVNVFGPDEVVYLLSNQLHSAMALENVEAIFVTIPPAEGFPD